MKHHNCSLELEPCEERTLLNAHLLIHPHTYAHLQPAIQFQHHVPMAKIKALQPLHAATVSRTFRYRPTPWRTHVSPPQPPAPAPTPIITNNLYGNFPTVWDWGSGLSYPMNGNDTLSDCTAAAVNDTIETWRDWSYSNDYCTLDQVKQFYFMTTGGADTGQDMKVVLGYWQSPGMASNTIYAWQHLNVFNHSALRAAIWDTVGGVEVSLALPQTAIQQTQSGQPWTLVTFTGNGAPYSGGAHEVELTGYNATNDTFQAISWGRHVTIAGAFLNAYTTDLYAVEGSDMFRTTGEAGNGQSYAQIASEVSRLAG